MVVAGPDGPKLSCATTTSTPCHMDLFTLLGNLDPDVPPGRCKPPRAPTADPTSPRACRLSSRACSSRCSERSRPKRTINGLEHRGLDRVRHHGADGFARAVALSVLAANLHRLGLLLQKRERKRRRRVA